MRSIKSLAKGARPAAIEARLGRAPRASARKLGCLLSIGLVASAISACGSSSGLSGDYTTTVTGSAGLERLVKGPWTVSFGKHGSYLITDGQGIGLSVGKGSYYRGTTFVIMPRSPGLCGPGPGTGIYKLKLTGPTLKFIPITEPCNQRAIVLAHTFTKAR